MAVVEIEIEQIVAKGLCELLTTMSWVVPTPTLETLAPDRLVAGTKWSSIALAEAAAPAAPTGALGLTAGLSVAHTSLQELRANPRATGQSVSYQAALSLAARVDPARLELRVDSLTPDGGARFDLVKPVPLFAQTLPDLPLVSVTSGAFLRGEGVVTLRLATAHDDVLTGSLKPRRLGDEAAAIFLPAALFTDLVLAQLRDAANDFPSDITVSRQPWADWSAAEGGATVTGGMTLVKRDACPTILGDVDVSVDVSLTLNITVRQDGPTTAFDLALTVETDASDWDSFRCWLGSGAIAGGLLGMFWPPAGVVTAIASLAAIGNSVAGAVAKPLGEVTIDDFRKVSSSDDSLSFAGGFTLPKAQIGVFSWLPVAFSADGLTIPVSALAPPPATHDIVLTPTTGILDGQWSGKINCSLRSQDWRFALTPVTITDTAKVLSFELSKLPVRVWSTSTAEPESQWYVSSPGDAIAQVVTVANRMLTSGAAGLAVIHSSAGLFAFTIPGPPPRDHRLDDSMQRVIDQFCDGQQMLSLDLNIVELRWVEPPPDYDFGFEALRHWQIGIEGLRPGERLRVTPVRGEQPVEGASVEMFASDAGRASAQLVTEADKELRVSRAEAGPPVTVRTRRRWLVPFEQLPDADRRITWRRGASGLEIDASAGRLRLAPEGRVDQRTWTGKSEGGEQALFPHDVVEVAKDRLLVREGDRLWLATPAAMRFGGG